MSKAGRLAVFAADWILAIWSIVTYGILLTVYLFFSVAELQRSDNFGSWIPLIGPVLTVVAICGWILMMLIFRKRRVDVNGLGRLCCLLLLAIPLAWLAIDEPPSKPIYTRADIAPPAKDGAESYKTLMMFRKDGGIKVETNGLGLALDRFPTNVLEHADAVENAWTNAAQAWAVMERLDSYDAIADLLPETELYGPIPILSYQSLRETARACWRHAILKVEQGQPREGALCLCRLESVTRKALPHASFLVNKMIWIAIAKGNISAACHISRSRNCDVEALKLLAASFGPLQPEDALVRRPMIGECLGVRTMMERDLKTDPFMFRAYGVPILWASCEKIVNAFAGPVLMNRNRTIREVEAEYDVLVQATSKCPPDLDTQRRCVSRYLRPRVKNMGAGIVLAISMPCFTVAGDNAWKTKALGDLLAIDLSRRLGEKLVLTDAYTGEPYIVDDATGEASSAGRDRKSGTADDITLGDWPY